MSYLCVFEFFDFEMVATNVVTGNRPYFDFNAKYLVTLDDFFIDYLRKGTAQLELLESKGTTFKSLGTTKLNFKDMISHPQTSFINSSITLFDQEGNHVCEIFYSYKMKEPFETSLMQYQERLRALEVVLPSQGSIINLKITILRCTSVKSNTESFPSLYVMYQFFDFPDHDTAIITSKNPEFEDVRTFTLPLTSDLDRYLKSNDLVVYVFDDREPEDASYLCMGKIQLVPLARGKGIQGPFQLFRQNGTPNGFIDVCITWDSTKINESVIKPASDKSEYSEPKKITQKSIKEPEKISEPFSGEEELRSIPKIAEPMTSLQFAGGDSLEEKKSTPKKENIPEIVVKPSETFKKEEILEKQIEEIQIMKEAQTVKDHHPPQNENILIEKKLSSILKMPDPPKKSSMPSIKTGDIDKSKLKRVRISEPKVQIEEPLEDFNESFSESKTDYIYEDDFEFSTEEVSENVERLPVDHLNETNDQVIITIHSFYANPIIMNDPRVMNLFVSYRFLNLPSEETETEFSLPKTNKKLDFNFTKVFNVNYSKNYENRQNLAVMLIREDPNSTGIFFAVVSEPESDGEGDCEDLGLCLVNMKDILKSKHDYIEKQFPVMNKTNEEIGTLTLTIKCYAVLKAIDDELDR